MAIVDKFIIFAISLVALSCKGGYMDFSACPYFGGRRESITNKLQLEKVRLDSVYTSYEINSGIFKENQIYLYDRYFGYLHLYGGDGSYIGRYAGLGRGPGEVVIKGAKGSAASPEGDFIVVGSTLDFVKINPAKEDTKYIRIPYNPDIEGDSENFSTYSYAFSNFSVFCDKDKVYLNMTAEHPKFNYLHTNKRFLKESRHIAVVDLKTKKAKMVVQGFPELYQRNTFKYFSQSLVNFYPRKDGGFLVSFEADSTIYICDSKGNPIKSFGSSGQNMDMDYEIVRTPRNQKGHQKNREEKGYYWHLFEDGDITMRSYMRGKTASDSGFQIYKGGVLIADVSVPKGFQVTGKIGEYYYSQVMENDGGSLYIYRFKL